VFHLGAQSLWVDEVLTWLSASIGHPLPFSELLENVHGPIFSLILHGWGTVAGDSEWAMRAPSMVFGVLLVPVVAWLGLRWLGRDKAIAAAWLTAGAPFLVWYSQEARNYTLLMLCAGLAGAALLELLHRARPWNVVVFLGAVAAGLLSNFSFAFLSPLYLRWWLTAGPGRARRMLLSGAVLAVLAIVMALWVPQILKIWDWRRLHPGREVTTAEAPLRGATTFHPAAIPFALHAFSVGYTLGPSLRELRAHPGMGTLRRHLPELVTVTLIFGWLGVAGLRAVARRGRLIDAALWLGFPILVVSYFAAQNFKVFHPRYLAVAAPGFLLVLAAGLVSLPARWQRVAWIAVAGVWSVSLAHHYFSPEYGKDDYRGALRRVAESARPGEQVLAVGAEDPVYYYYRGPLSVDRLWLGFAADPPKLNARLAEKLAAAPGTWVVLSRSEDLDPAGVFARLMDARTSATDRFAREGVRVWHLASR
jgi:mannosyltransferase